jgi:DDE_Tnp_1-associated
MTTLLPSRAPSTWGGAWLETFLALLNGIPSHDTFRRVFMLIDPDAFEVARVRRPALEPGGNSFGTDGAEADGHAFSLPCRTRGDPIEPPAGLRARQR